MQPSVVHQHKLPTAKQHAKRQPDAGWGSGQLTIIPPQISQLRRWFPLQVQVSLPHFWGFASEVARNSFCIENPSRQIDFHRSIEPKRNMSITRVRQTSFSIFFPCNLQKVVGKRGKRGKRGSHLLSYETPPRSSVNTAVFTAGAEPKAQRFR